MKYKVHVAVFSLWAIFAVISAVLLQGSLSLTPSPHERWTLTHIVDPETYQGQRVLSYLIKRESAPQYDELVILLEPHDTYENQLEEKGFIVSHANFAEIRAEEPRVTAPFFLITSPRGEGVYAGSYPPKLQDLALAKSFFSSQSLSYFPIYGCGNSVRIQKALDPQGILLSKKKSASNGKVL